MTCPNVLFRDDMKISIVQSPLTWEDRQTNFRNLAKLVASSLGNTDLIILPETFSTGFTMNVAENSEKMKGETYNWMKDLAIRGGCAVCGSYIVEEEGRFSNRFMFVTACTEFRYDKRHLFSIGGEDKHFTRGGARTVFTYLGVRISPYVCYDLRFPVWSRNRNEYDLAIYVSNWPQARIEVWNTLLRARAIENQCFVAGSNRTGTDGEGVSHNGMSQIIDPRGNVIISAGEVSGKVISAEISMDDLTTFRNKFNVLRDRDDFEIINL
jgi:omega-amidase